MEEFERTDESVRQRAYDIGLPNAHTAIRGFDEQNRVVYVAQTRSQQTYRCAFCADEIYSGIAHVVARTITIDEKRDHHHYDFQCFCSRLLPKLVRLELIEPDRASKSVLNKKIKKMRQHRQPKTGR